MSRLGGREFFYHYFPGTADNIGRHEGLTGREDEHVDTWLWGGREETRGADQDDREDPRPQTDGGDARWQTGWLWEWFSMLNTLFKCNVIVDISFKFIKIFQTAHNLCINRLLWPRSDSLNKFSNHGGQSDTRRIKMTLNFDLKVLQLNLYKSLNY